MVGGLASLTARGALSTIDLVLGLGRSINTSYKIRRAAKSIENYLGGKPEITKRNSVGDLYMVRGDKKIRFDINNYQPHHEPHFHIEKTVPKTNGRGVDWIAVDKNHHFYPFKKE